MRSLDFYIDDGDDSDAGDGRGVGGVGSTNGSDDLIGIDDIVGMDLSNLHAEEAGTGTRTGTTAAAVKGERLAMRTTTDELLPQEHNRAESERRAAVLKSVERARERDAAEHAAVMQHVAQAQEAAQEAAKRAALVEQQVATAVEADVTQGMNATCLVAGTHLGTNASTEVAASVVDTQDAAEAAVRAAVHAQVDTQGQEGDREFLKLQDLRSEVVAQQEELQSARVLLAEAATLEADKEAAERQVFEQEARFREEQAQKDRELARQGAQLHAERQARARDAAEQAAKEKAEKLTAMMAVHAAELAREKQARAAAELAAKEEAVKQAKAAAEHAAALAHERQARHAAEQVVQLVSERDAQATQRQAKQTADMEAEKRKHQATAEAEAEALLERKQAAEQEAGQQQERRMAAHEQDQASQLKNERHARHIAEQALLLEKEKQARLVAEHEAHLERERHASMVADHAAQLMQLLQDRLAAEQAATQLEQAQMQRAMDTTPPGQGNSSVAPGTTAKQPPMYQQYARVLQENLELRKQLHAFKQAEEDRYSHLLQENRALEGELEQSRGGGMRLQVLAMQLASTRAALAAAEQQLDTVNSQTRDAQADHANARREQAAALGQADALVNSANMHKMEAHALRAQLKMQRASTAHRSRNRAKLENNHSADVLSKNSAGGHRNNGLEKDMVQLRSAHRNLHKNFRAVWREKEALRLQVEHQAHASASVPGVPGTGMDNVSRSTTRCNTASHSANRGRINKTPQDSRAMKVGQIRTRRSAAPLQADVDAQPHRFAPAALAARNKQPIAAGGRSGGLFFASPANHNAAEPVSHDMLAAAVADIPQRTKQMVAEALIALNTSRCELPTT